MGTWGSGILDDDVAVDFLDELRSGGEPLERAREAFDDAADAAYLEYDEGQAALVSAAVVDAVLNGTRLGLDDEEVRRWLAGLDADEWSPLRTAAAKACLRVIGASSEVQELWAENEEEFPRWRQHIEGLAARLIGPQ
ncbi:MAG: DUF4259 domain-containing protein [Anaeromyxobacteraceae bacterium]